MTMNLKTVGFIASFAIALQSTYASDKRLCDEEGRCGGKAPQVSCVEDSDHYDPQDLIHLFVNYPDELLLEFLRYDGVANYIVASFCAPSDPQPGYQLETFTDQACCYRDIFLQEMSFDDVASVPEKLTAQERLDLKVNIARRVLVRLLNDYDSGLTCYIRDAERLQDQERHFFQPHRFVISLPVINLDEESVSFPSALQLIDLRGTEAIKGDLMPWLRLIISNKFLFRTTSLSEIDALTLYQALIELKAELFQEATSHLKPLVNKHVKLFCFVTLLKAGPGEFSQLCKTFQHLFPTETNPVRILKSLEDAGMTSPKHLKALSNLMPAKATGDGIRYIIS